MLRIYHVPGTRGMRAIWVCEEISHPYEIVPVDFSGEYRATPEWRKMNPTGKVPVMTDGDLKVFESGAMVHYILDRYGNGHLQPEAGTIEHAYFLQWLWFSEATFSRPVGEIVNHRREFPGENEIPEIVEEMQSRIFKCVVALDRALEGKSFILGTDFTAADISLGYTLSIAKNRIPEPFPKRVANYWDSISSRKGFLVAKDT